MTPELGIIVVAAGNGTRLAAAEPKAFASLRGAPILERALRGVFDSAEPAQVVVVAPASHLQVAQAIADRVAGAAAGAVSVVAGGETRQASVAAGLVALAPEVATVLVHDAARALTPPALIDRVVRAVRATGGGVVPALPVTDTIKRVGSDAVVVGTLERSDLVHVQTPQGFPRAELDAAYAGATEEHTDDAALFAASGGTVSVVDGEAHAFKITTPSDLRQAETVLAGRAPGAQAAGLRVGTGFDTHAYDESVPLWLGGLYWPGEPGLSGHSDGDAVLHAICDALLSGAGLGDLGSRFGTADPGFAGAASEVFVRETLAFVHGAGFGVVNVAVQVVATRPRVAPRRSELESQLSALVGAPVTIGATTTDGLGFTGRGEGVAVFATALLTASA